MNVENSKINICRKGLCQESYDSIFTWFEIQNHSLSPNRTISDRTENLEGYDFRPLVACSNRSHGHFQICQAKGSKLRSCSLSSSCGSPY